MVHFRVTLLLIFISQNAFSQIKTDIFGEKIIFSKVDEIQYAIHPLNKDKKTIFLIEGSVPFSSYYNYNDTVYYTGPKEIMKLSTVFNLIVLGKPGIPILIDYEFLNKDYVYKDSTGKIPAEFLQNDNVAFYTKRYNEIINKISYEYGLDDIYIFGHSQGSRIAANLALNNKNIKGVILSSVDPLGRIASVIDKDYSNFEKKDKTEYLQSIVQNGSNSIDSTFMNSTYYSWQSFSYPLIITLSKIEIPILMIYGTQDTNCPNCYVYGYLDNYIPNLKSLSYDGYDHNFIDKKGIKHWDGVIKDVIYWIKEK